jgi:hypothetical protein
MIRHFVEEAAALVSLALFISMVAIFAAIVGGTF